MELPKYIDVACYGMEGTWEREDDKPLVDDVLAECIAKYLEKMLKRNDVRVNVKIENIEEGTKLVGVAEIFIGDREKYGALLIADAGIDNNTVKLSDVYLEIVR